MVHYIRLQSLVDVTEMLWSDGPNTLLIAGGTDILVRERPFSGKQILLDISRVKELSGIGLDSDGNLRIGAAETHQQVVDHPMVWRRAHLLGLACGEVGSFQIRNRGTLGGNLGNASPAGDSIPAMACLDAQVVVVGRSKHRTMPVLSLFAGPGKTILGADEVIESIRIPVRKGRTANFFKKAGQRKGMCCSKATVAFCARWHSDGSLSQVAVAVGAVAPMVLRVPHAEQLLEGRLLDLPIIREASEACSQATQPIDDIRSTQQYRRQVVGALLTEGLLEIYDHMHSIQKRREERSRSKK